MAENNQQIADLQKQVAELQEQLAQLKAQGVRGTIVRALSERAAAFKASLVRAKTVKVRVSRFVKGKGPEGTMVQVAQPINLGAPGWRRLWTPPTGFPTVLEPGTTKDGKFVPNEYELPEPIAKALVPDLQIVN